MEKYIDKTSLKSVIKILKENFGSKSELEYYANKRYELLLNINEPKLSFDTNWIIGDGASSYVGTAIVGASYVI